MKDIIQRLMCKFLGNHKLEPYLESDKLDPKGNKIGIVIVSKCTICGRIISKTIYTEIDRM